MFARDTVVKPPDRSILQPIGTSVSMGYTAWAAEHRIAKWYTPNLFFASGLLALSSLSYGFDTQTFNGLQALPAFKDQFGEANAKGVKVSLRASHYIAYRVLTILHRLFPLGICLPSIP